MHKFTSEYLFYDKNCGSIIGNLLPWDCYVFLLLPAYMKHKSWIIIFHHVSLFNFFFEGGEEQRGWFSINIADSHSQLSENIFSSTLQRMAVMPQSTLGGGWEWNGILQEMLWCYATEIFSALAQWWKKWLSRAKGILKSLTIHQILFIVQSTAAEESTDKERHNTLLLVISTPGSQEFAEHIN